MDTERTIYPEYDFANNGVMMHFSTFIRIAKDGDNYLVPVVRHYVGDDMPEQEFIDLSIALCERVKENYIIDLTLSKDGSFGIVKENEDGEEN